MGQASLKFAHLHLHTEYSPQDAPIGLKSLVVRAKDLGYKALAISDHGTVSGWVQFAQLCKEFGIHPIFGVEAYFTDKRLDRSSGRDNDHILLLAKDAEGIHNIFKMSDLSWKEGFYYDPRVDWELLEKYHEGIVCTSACVGGVLGEAYKRGGLAAARARTERLRGIFGEDFYVEVQYHGLAVEEEVYVPLAGLARDLGIKVVGTNDVHYLRKEDANTQEAMMALNMGKCVKDPSRMRHDSNHFYLKSPDEMIECLGGPNQMAVQSTLEIADKCNAHLKFGKAQLPSMEIPKEATSEIDYLESLAREGLRRLGKEGDPTYEARFKEEMGVIRRLKEKGHAFDRYFLIVWDYVNWAWNNGIRVGIGRGSGAGSLLLYCLRVTGLDPIPLDLLFERFLDEDRNEMPDIDIDFDAERGDEVYQYVCRKYGEDHCARIITFQTFHVASAIKAAYRVFDPGDTWEKEQHHKKVAENQRNVEQHKGSMARSARREPVRDESAFMANEATKLLPKNPSGQPSINCTLSREKHEKKPDELIYVYDQVPEFRGKRLKFPEIFEFAEALEGLVKDRSVHAAGVLITQDPITDLCPRQYAGKGKEKTLSTAFDMGDVEKLGGVKFDFLRTKVLSVLTRALRMIKEGRGIDVPIDTLVPDDPKALGLFAAGETLGIFQFESDGMRKLLKDLKPDCFEDIIAANALFRPGPMEDIPKYLERKHNPSKIKYDAPALEPILKPTYGVLVYQEQVMRAVRALAGFNGSEADKVRKAMGKKKADILAQMKGKFLDGCSQRKTCPPEVAKKIWETLQCFGEYGFNKSHSAAYAYTAYQTAYLKAHYPAEFWAAQLTVEGWDGAWETVPLYERGAKAMGLSLLPLDINLSKAEYLAANKSIRRGLKGVKGIGDSHRDIVAGQPYRDMYDYCARSGSGVKSDVVQSLLDGGAFDHFLPGLSKRLERVATRKDLELEYIEQNKRAQAEKRQRGAMKEEKDGIGSFFKVEDDLVDAAKTAEEFKL